MIITDLYKTIITSDTTRVNILNQREVIVTVKLVDYNNNLITNKNVQVSSNGVYFTAYNNTSSNTYTTITSTRNYIFNTGASGILKIKVKALSDVMGYASVNANNSHLLIEMYRDTGWCDVSFQKGFRNYYRPSYMSPPESLDVPYPVRYRCYNNFVEIRGIFTNNGVKDYVIDGDATYMFASIPSTYAPSHNVIQLQQGSNGNRFYALVNTNGEISFGKYVKGTSYVNLKHNNSNEEGLDEVGDWLHCNLSYLLG